MTRSSVMLLLSCAPLLACDPLPPPEPLLPCEDVKLAWSYPLPSGTTLKFDGVSDALRNLYWLECAQQHCLLVSYTPSGEKRMSRSVDGVGPAALPIMAVAGRIYLLDRELRPVAVSDETGDVLWRSPGAAFVLEWAADRGGNLWTLERKEGTPRRHYIASYAADTGAMRALVGLEGEPGGLLLDADGNAYAAMWGVDATDLLSLTPAGALRFQGAVPSGSRPQASFLNQLLMSDGQLRSTVDGRLLPASPSSQSGFSPLMSKDARFRLALDAQEAVMLEGYTSEYTDPVFRVEAGRWSGNRTEPLLLSKGSALFASGNRLRAIDATGAETLSCELGTSKPGGASALVSGKLVVLDESDGVATVKAFTVPGVQRAEAGWTGPGGSPGRNGQAR